MQFKESDGFVVDLDRHRCEAISLRDSSDISDRCLSEMSDTGRGETARSNQTKTVQNPSETDKYAELYVRYRQNPPPESAV